jgi:hypothetical protein
MFNKVFVFSVLIGAVAAELSPGLYRIFNPEITTAGYVAKSGEKIGLPVTLSLSQPSDLHELVSFSLCRLIDQTGAHI